MTALSVAVLLVGFAAACGASLLRLRGTVSFALAVAVLAFAEIVAVSHALSLFGVYTRGWFLVTVTVLAAAAGCATAIVRPRGPELGRVGAVARELGGDPVVAVLVVLVLLGARLPDDTRAVHAAGGGDVNLVPPHPGDLLDPAAPRRRGRGRY